VKESKIKRPANDRLAIRRAFISSLKLRSRLGKNSIITFLPVDLPENPTILFLRQDRLGDAIVSTPVLVELYKKYPKGHFIILLGENNKGIGRSAPNTLRSSCLSKKPIADISMLRNLRKRKIDILIDLIDNTSSTSSILISAITLNFLSESKKITLHLRCNCSTRRPFEESYCPTYCRASSSIWIDPAEVSLSPQLKDIATRKVTGRAGIILSAGAPNRYITSAKLLPRSR